MKKLAFPFTIIAASIISTVAIAAPDESKMFGAAAPFTIDKLPTSRLKTQLESLPAAAREKAMKWLHSFTFPAHDIKSLHVDNGGGVFYQDTVLPEQISQSDLEADPSLEGISPTDAFKLHSRPGAAKVVYVNFTGFTLANTAWNSSVSSYQAKPFNKDSDPSTFSTAERTDIAEVWHRIAEDFAPFDIDVTTEKPASFGPDIGHILVTSKTDATGTPMPYDTAGGVAYVGVWGRSNYEYYQPALVYYDNLASAPYYIAEAASHELGHNLALSHDGTSTQGYYSGHGSGLTSWGPVMGVGYYTNVTQWSKGEYPDANNSQDDLAIIAQRLGYRMDDHGNDQTSASQLLVDGNGNIASSNPEIDPLNARPDNKGVIGSSTDSDVFYFDTAAGEINLVINPAWDAYTRTSKRGANLDIQAKITDGFGTEIIVDPISDTNAVITAVLGAGRYYLTLTGVGNTATSYSDYASLGQYYISGTVVTLASDFTPPNPNPMLWANYPTAVSKTSISMTAVEATDDSGVVEYQFVCSSGGLGCVSSTWQSEANYVATGLEANTEYSYQVKARDNSGNETGFSPVATAWTLTNMVPQSMDDYVTVSENTATVIDVMANDTDPDGDTLQIVSTSVSANGDVEISGNAVVYTPNANYTGADSFTYMITDGVGGNSTSTVYLDVVGVNDAPVAAPDSAEVLLGGSVSIDVLANDRDPEGSVLSVVSATNGSKGTTLVNADGTITYSVTGNKRGGDSFTYVVSDGELSSSTTVNISIVRSLSGGGGSGGGSGKCHPKKGC